MVKLCKSLDKADLPLFISSVTNKVAEEKQDGDRIVFSFKAGKLSMFNRRGNEVSRKYPEFKDFTFDGEFVLDGEMCVMKNGISAFNEGIAFRTHCEDPGKIKQAAQEYPCTFVVFDLLELFSSKGSGSDLRKLMLFERRKILEETFRNIKHPSMQLIEQSTDILGLWKKVTKLGGEGIIIKDINSRYDDKRNDDWIKVKDIKEVDLEFTSYTTHPMGIRCVTEKEIAITVNGINSYQVRKLIDDKGCAKLTIRHLGETKNHKFRQPVFMKVVEE